jgi:hypothetical protein
MDMSCRALSSAVACLFSDFLKLGVGDGQKPPWNGTVYVWPLTGLVMT